ncbi:MAG: DMT family transporter [Hyphomonadaceae bacterium]|nr:DMT family transporter [Hyphomonadaceae bacterium]
MPDSSLAASPSSTPRAARNLTGAAWMIASGIGFTVYLVMAKQVSSEAHPIVLAFFRSFFGLVFVSPILMRQGTGFLKTPRFGLLFTRSLFGTLGFIFSLLAVSDFFTLPLSQFNALSFSRPLFVTLLAALFLGEAVGPHRFGAVTVGFIGVLIMAVPGVIFFWLPDGAGPPLDLGSLLAISSAFFFAGAITLVKSLSATHSPIQLVVWANLLSSILLLPGLIWFWSPPSPMAWLMIITMALTGLAAQFCYIKAMSMGDASFLSPMDYLRLPMAAVADFLLFQLLPGRYVWIGAAIIVLATLYITLREARLRQRAPPTGD